MIMLLLGYAWWLVAACIAGLEVVVRPGGICLCCPSCELPVAFTVSEEFKVRFVQHLSIKVYVCIFTGLPLGRWCQTTTVESLPEPSSSLPNLDKDVSWYGRTIHIFQVRVSIFITFRLSMSAMSFLLGCQAIHFASQVIAICLKGFYSPKADLTVVIWIKEGWEFFGCRQCGRC